MLKECKCNFIQLYIFLHKDVDVETNYPFTNSEFFDINKSWILT